MTASATPAPAVALVVAAHPDDCDFGCGGTLAQWAAGGSQTCIAVLTDGTKGSHDPDLTDAVLRDRREREQRAAAAALGAGEVRFAGRTDGALAADAGIVEWVTAVIRELRPEIVLTHDPWRPYDMHPDHAVAGAITRAALYDAREPRAARELARRGLEPWRPRELWLFAAAEPDHVEDVTAGFDAKLAALLCHVSQHGTSFGIAADGAGRDRFADAVREHATGTAADTPGRLGEAFKRIALAGPFG